MANKLLGNSGNTNASAADSEVMMTSINKVTHERIGEGNLEPLMGTKNNVSVTNNQNLPLSCDCQITSLASYHRGIRESSS